MRVLTWNLFHGRALPPAGRDLQPQFAAALAGWDWDVALLQEVPPWWPPALARACDAQALLGGDFNVRAPRAPGFEPLGGHGVDHVLGRGFAAAGAPELPDRA